MPLSPTSGYSWADWYYYVRTYTPPRPTLSRKPHVQNPRGRTIMEASTLSNPRIDPPNRSTESVFLPWAGASLGWDATGHGT
jgi:hypothetical protein